MTPPAGTYKINAVEGTLHVFTGDKWVQVQPYVGSNTITLTQQSESFNNGLWRWSVTHNGIMKVDKHPDPESAVWDQ